MPDANEDRDLFAQLLAKGYSQEEIWQAQAGRQFPQQRENPEVAWMKAFKGTEGEGNWLPQQQLTRSQFDFPMATPYGTPSGDPVAVDAPPFGGKGEVVGTYMSPGRKKDMEAYLKARDKKGKH